MVNIVEDWDALEEYAGEKLAFYQLLANNGRFKIRVLTGELCFRVGNWRGKQSKVTKLKTEEKKGDLRVISPLVARFKSPNCTARA